MFKKHYAVQHWVWKIHSALGSGLAFGPSFIARYLSLRTEPGECRTGRENHKKISWFSSLKPGGHHDVGGMMLYTQISYELVG